MWVLCCFVFYVNAFYQIQTISPSSQTAKKKKFLNNKWEIDLLKCISCVSIDKIIWLSTLSLLTWWITSVDFKCCTKIASWSKSHLVMVYSSFYTSIDSVANFFLGFLHLNSWEILVCNFLFAYTIFAWRQNQGNTGLKKWVGKPFLCFFSEMDYIILIYFFSNAFLELLSETILTWRFLFPDNLNCRLNPFNDYRYIQMTYFILHEFL